MDPGLAKSCTSGTETLSRFALDTNLLAYADGVGQSDADRQKALLARQLVVRLGAEPVRAIVALQSLGELHQVLCRKLRFSKSEAGARVRVWRRTFDVALTSEAVFDAALELAADHQLQIYDAIILAAAVDARCDLLLSEDLQDGFAWRGCVVANPFADKLEPRLARLLA